MLKRIKFAGFMALFNQLFSGTQRAFIFIALMLFGSPVFAQLIATTNAVAAIDSGVTIAVTIGAAALSLLATIAAIKWIRGVL